MLSARRKISLLNDSVQLAVLAVGLSFKSVYGDTALDPLLNENP